MTPTTWAAVGIGTVPHPESGSGAPCRDAVVTHRARDGQVSARRVQMTKLATSHPEFDSAKVMFVDAHAVPGRGLADHRLACAAALIG